MTAIASVNERSPHGAPAPTMTPREFSDPAAQPVRRRALGVAGILYKPFELDELSRLLASAGGAPTS